MPRDRNLDDIVQLNDVEIVNKIDCENVSGAPSVQLSICCSANGATSLTELFENEEEIRKTIQIFNVEKPFFSRQGYGRSIKLKKPETIGSVVEKVKELTELKNVRLALANEKTIDSKVSTIAVCAGSGSTVFSALRQVDLQITGELSHHAVLDAIHRGTTVILCDHTNTERGFLRVVKEKFQRIFADGRIDFVISRRDRDPLEIV